MIENFRKRGEGGFTLIELLVVIAIIGILAAIAIPQFAAYRKRGFDSQVRSDLRNAATAQEAYFTTSNPSTYKTCTGCDTADLPGFNPSNNVTVNTTAVNPNDFEFEAVHNNCGTDKWTYKSLGGKIDYTKGDQNCAGAP